MASPTLDAKPPSGATQHGQRMEHPVAARIYQVPKNAMQSGKALTHNWVLDYVPAEAKSADPLTGWAGSGDMKQQLRLTFPSAEAAKAYADREGISATIIPTAPKTLKLQAYADNFR